MWIVPEKKNITVQNQETKKVEEIIKPIQQNNENQNEQEELPDFSDMLQGNL